MPVTEHGHITWAQAVDIIRRAAKGLPLPGEGFVELNARGSRYVIHMEEHALIPKGIISSYDGGVAPKGWAFCDGSNGAPDLRGRVLPTEKATWENMGR